MSNGHNLLTLRKTLDQICSVPDKIISVYSLEQHVWSGSNSEAARKARKPELKTIEEFQIEPVRPFLNDVLRNMAAPYKPDNKENPIGQGYWIQAEFGSGKSHVLSFLAALALGQKAVWDIVKEKEQKANRGKRESLYRFWEEGLESKNSKGKKGIFVIVKTLVGAGGGAIGLSEQGRKLTEYILDAAKEQLLLETGKNLSLYPSELLADRFITTDVDRFRNDLRKFLKDSNYFEEDEYEEVDDFIREIQQNKSPEYKKSCGNKLWRFYTEYLDMTPNIEAETEDILKHLVKTILDEGYSGVLLVLDEVSLFMKNRDESQRTDDEKTLVVLSNRLAKVHNLPIWTVCAAQQAIESKMGVKNIIADDRLKLVKLLEKDTDYYDIVLARVREIKEPAAIGNYYQHYKRGFSWPNSIGEDEFRHFFPFHKPALEVVRAITYELTTARSAIHFMHQTLKHQIKNKGNELIRLWELFDEAVHYEEDPSGVHAGLVAIKTKRETDYRAYESCKAQIDGLTKGYLKVYRDKAVKTIQTLFLYHIARIAQQGVPPEEIANSVLIDRSEDSNVDENIQHYETIADKLKIELRQVVQDFDEDKKPRYRFDPVFTGVDPRTEFQKAKDEAEANEVIQKEALQHLIALDEWPVTTRQMTLDLSGGIKSIFCDVTPASGDTTLEVNWLGRLISGKIGMRDLGRIANENSPLPPINSSGTDLDFAVFIGTKPVPVEAINKLLSLKKDPRIIYWTPGELTHEERNLLLNFAAYRRLINDWQGKDTEDAVTVINWVSNSLQTELGKIKLIIDNSYARGRMDAVNNTQMDFHVAGELTGILTPIVERVLNSVYASKSVKFEHPFVFRKEEGVKVINGIVKTGNIPKGAKPTKDISAAQNFGFGLMIMKKSAEKQLDITGNPFTDEMWQFIDDKLADEAQIMNVETIYKNFMGIGGPKDYGLTQRMVQIFLLCLVREGKLKVTVGPKSGLPTPIIDYSNISSIDFSAKILDSMDKIQKVAKPENWEILRPYAEKLLGEEIPVTHDDAVISDYRSKLRELFKNEKEEAERTSEKATRLFDELKTNNPYANELNQAVQLFKSDIESGDDINLTLYYLKEAYGYKAFDSNCSDQSEVDDLSNRLTNYSDLKRFLQYEVELRSGMTYCNHTLPDFPELKSIIKTQNKLASKLKNPQPYIDSEVKLKTELIGKTPPETGETGTLGVLIHEYTSAYTTLHDNLINHTDNRRSEIIKIIKGNGFKALRIIEKISALQPEISDFLEAQLFELENHVFTCPNPSRASIVDRLKRHPIHECKLSFDNAGLHMQEADSLLQEAKQQFKDAVHGKLEVFLTPGVRERLTQGRSEPIIEAIMGCTTPEEVWKVLEDECLADPSVVDTINKYLKKILVKKIKLSDFKPSVTTVEKNQIQVLIQEFQKYLEDAIEEIDDDQDALPMLQVE